MAEIELDKVPGWSPDHVARLAASWINSAEQVVAISATDGGLDALAQQLGVSKSEAHRLVALAHAALPPAAQAAMRQRFDADDRGLGANRPGAPPGKAVNDEE